MERLVCAVDVVDYTCVSDILHGRKVPLLGDLSVVTEAKEEDGNASSKVDLAVIASAHHDRAGCSTALPYNQRRSPRLFLAVELSERARPCLSNQCGAFSRTVQI